MAAPRGLEILYEHGKCVDQEDFRVLRRLDLACQDGTIYGGRDSNGIYKRGITGP